MSKKTTLKLDYRKAGEENTVEINVDWISNYCQREFGDIAAEVTEIKSAWDRMKVILSDRGTLLFECKEGKITKDEFSQKIKILDKEDKELENRIKSYDEKSFFKRRFELVKQILTDNKCPHEFLYDYDFWDKCVSPTDLMVFLSRSVYKDIDNGKSKGGAKKK
jgi:hypothetical protein